MWGPQDPAEGRVQVLVSPLQRLTNQAQAPIEDVGTPEGILGSLGSYITGTYLDEEDVCPSHPMSSPARTCWCAVCSCIA